MWDDWNFYIYSQLHSMLQMFSIHNRIDATPLAVGTPELDDDPVALYLGYYDWGPQRQL